MLQVHGTFIYFYSAILSNWNNGESGHGRTGCHCQGNCVHVHLAVFTCYLQNCGILQLISELFIKNL